MASIEIVDIDKHSLNKLKSGSSVEINGKSYKVIEATTRYASYTHCYVNRYVLEKDDETFWELCVDFNSNNELFLGGFIYSKPYLTELNRKVFTKYIFEAKE